MLTGYYGNPLFRRSHDFIPQGSMSAVVTRDAVATNSYAGPQGPSYPPLAEAPSIDENDTAERVTEKNVDYPLQGHVLEPEEPENVGSIVPSVELPLEEEVAKVPNRTPKKKPVKVDEEEEEDVAAAWPFSTGKGSVPSYNAFFPIMISGTSPGRRRSGNEDEYFPGSATAIANSFSTGKGGIATSHATSFGDPYLSAMFRDALLNSKKSKKGEA